VGPLAIALGLQFTVEAAQLGLEIPAERRRRPLRHPGTQDRRSLRTALFDRNIAHDLLLKQAAWEEIEGGKSFRYKIKLVALNQKNSD